MPRLEHATQTNSDRSVCQSGKLNEIMNSRCDLKISHLLRFKPQVPRDGPESPHVYNISWHNFFCKAGNREICCRLRIVILFSIANLRMRLLRLFLCSLKEESRRIKNMRKKEKPASRLSHAPLGVYMRVGGFKFQFNAWPKAPCKRTQHCWPTTPNTVGPNNVVTCCVRLHKSTTMLALVGTCCI